MYDQPCCRKNQYHHDRPHLRRYILNVIETDIDPHLIDPFAGICIEVLHDRTSLDRRFVRILGIELTSCLLLRSCYDVIRIRIITTEEITKRIFCCIFLSIFRTIIPVQIIKYCIIIFASCNNRSISDVVHISDCIVRS